MDIRVIKLCPLYEDCPKIQCRDGERVYIHNEPFIYFKPCSCLRKRPDQRKGYICTIQVDLSKTTLEKALDDVLNNRKKYTKFYYVSEVDDYISRLKEMIKNDGRS